MMELMASAKLAEAQTASMRSGFGRSLPPSIGGQTWPLLDDRFLMTRAFNENEGLTSIRIATC